MSEPFPIEPLDRAALPVDTVALARFMVGQCLVHDLPEGRVSGRIVETEAYPVGDSTSHAYRGLRPYNAALFEAPGHAYVRLVYGACYMINISSERSGVGAAVLLRAVEPLDGVARMQARRQTARAIDLARGPGRLCAAFGIGPEWDGADLCAGHALWLGHLAEGAARGATPLRVAVTRRIGLSREIHAPLRFYAAGSPFVSGPRRWLEPVTPA